MPKKAAVNGNGKMFDPQLGHRVADEDERQFFQQLQEEGYQHVQSLRALTRAKGPAYTTNPGHFKVPYVNGNGAKGPKVAEWTPTAMLKYEDGPILVLHSQRDFTPVDRVIHKSFEHHFVNGVPLQGKLSSLSHVKRNIEQFRELVGDAKLLFRVNTRRTTKPFMTTSPAFYSEELGHSYANEDERLFYTLLKKKGFVYKESEEDLMNSDVPCYTLPKSVFVPVPTGNNGEAPTLLTRAYPADAAIRIPGKKIHFIEMKTFGAKNPSKYRQFADVFVKGILPEKVDAAVVHSYDRFRRLYTRNGEELRFHFIARGKEDAQLRVNKNFPGKVTRVFKRFGIE